MRQERPDPDVLLRQIHSQAPARRRGRLKVFLGAAAGVGKTYAMLSDARAQKERGVDVVLGYAETHGRKETETLLNGLDVLPLRKIAYRGIFLREFDLDGALGRSPQLVIVDELAHTNAPESRHPKRWQDVEELLDAGINVYTAVNIQHLESLTDVVAQVTGVIVRETVPDSFVDRADDIEVIDLPPEELRDRVREGKVYVSESIDQALQDFFKLGNLTALRELALRRAADRVDAEARTLREDGGGATTRERILVCVAPNRLGDRVVRAAARMGVAAHAEMFALLVESDRQERRSPEAFNHAEEALRMAERLGMEPARRQGHDIAGVILDYANTKGVTLIVVGKPLKQRWRELLFGSVVDELVRRSAHINVQVLSSEERSERQRIGFKIEPPIPADYAWAVLGTLLPTIICLLIYPLRLPPESLVAIYLLAIAYVGSKTTPVATVLSCVLNVVAYDIFFVEPRFRFAVSDWRYIPAFGVMFLTALLISSLTLQMRRHAEAASQRERRTAALYDLSKQLARGLGPTEVAKITALKIQNDLNADAAVLIPNERGRLESAAPSRSQFEQDRQEYSVAQWCFEHAKPAGAGTDTLPGSLGTYFPLTTDRRVLGVLCCTSAYYQQRLDLSQRPMLQTFANSLALALERATLSRETEEARVSAETERIRSSLLSSVSHDIRSPLTAIQGAATALVAHQGDPDDLARTIKQASDRLNRQVRNLLEMTRLESGTVRPKLDWEDPEELTGNAIRRAEAALEQRHVAVTVEPGLPLLKADGNLVELALTNLLENAARHTPPQTDIEVQVKLHDGLLRFAVMDRGPGVREDLRPHLFEKFTQAQGDREGFGLGLAIAGSAMKVQGGSTGMEDRVGGGATFYLDLPLAQNPPKVGERDEEALTGD